MPPEASLSIVTAARAAEGPCAPGTGGASEGSGVPPPQPSETSGSAPCPMPSAVWPLVFGPHAPRQRGWPLPERKLTPCRTAPPAPWAGMLARPSGPILVRRLTSIRPPGSMYPQFPPRVPVRPTKTWAQPVAQQGTVLQTRSPRTSRRWRIRPKARATQKYARHTPPCPLDSPRRLQTAPGHLVRGLHPATSATTRVAQGARPRTQRPVWTTNARRVPIRPQAR